MSISRIETYVVRRVQKKSTFFARTLFRNLLLLYRDRYQRISPFLSFHHIFTIATFFTVEKYIRFRESRNEKERKHWEFIVATAINRVYSRTNEKSAYLDKKELALQADCLQRLLPCLTRIQLFFPFH